MNSSGTVTATNTLGADGLISRNTSASGSTFYAFDNQGTTSQRLNSSGVVQTNAIIDAFGAVAGAVATDPYSGYNSEWGYYNDSGTGLQLLGHRFYDQATGRFINRDPIGYDGGINVYGYCGNGPTSWFDPSGTQSIPWPGIGGGIIGGGEIGGEGGSVAGPGGTIIGGVVGGIIGAIIGGGFNGGTEVGPPGSFPPSIAPGPHRPIISPAAGGGGINMKDPSTWPTPPGPGPFKQIPPSRSKPASRGECSVEDSQGGEWRPHLPDKHHPPGPAGPGTPGNPHWDYKPGGNPNNPWQNIPW